MDFCSYCDATISCDETIPPVDDDETWATIALTHMEGCVWIATRNFQEPLINGHVL